MTEKLEKPQLEKPPKEFSCRAVSDQHREKAAGESVNEQRFLQAARAITWKDRKMIDKRRKPLYSPAWRILRKVSELPAPAHPVFNSARQVWKETHRRTVGGTARLPASRRRLALKNVYH